MTDDLAIRSNDELNTAQKDGDQILRFRKPRFRRGIAVKAGHFRQNNDDLANDTKDVFGPSFVKPVAASDSNDNNTATSKEEIIKSVAAVAEDSIEFDEILRRQTVGLVHLDDFRKVKHDILKSHDESNKELQRSSSANSQLDAQQCEKRSRIALLKRQELSSRLSFHNDLAKDSHDRKSTGIDGDDQSVQTASVSANAHGVAQQNLKYSIKDLTTNTAANTVEQNRKRLKPDPTADTSFIKYTDEMEAREQQKKVHIEAERDRRAKIENEDINVPIIFFDGNTHKHIVSAKKGVSVEDFLIEAKRSIEKLRGEDVDRLLLVKSTMILPHHLRLIDFDEKKILIGHKRLLDFNDFNDFNIENRAVNKTDTELNTAKAALSTFNEKFMPWIVTQKWYKENKHRWPANRWITYDWTKDYSNVNEKVDSGTLLFYQN